MTQIIARQYAPKQIRCNAILPGMMDTPHIRTLYKDLPADKFKEVMAGRDAKCPMGRQGTCWDVANAAVFLASEDASRSEEHTSELQPLMRISYAVFCLK